MIKVGIGITTFQREEIFKKTHAEICKFIPKDYQVTIYVATDYIFERKGIAKRKNECIDNLKHCDYIFLFDDDCFPIHEDWIKFFIEASKVSKCHHFNYLTDEIHKKKSTYWYSDNIVVSSYKNCGGVMMFLTKQAIEKVGGFFTEYDTYGFEHIGYSMRVFLSGLNNEMFLCPDGADKYLKALDYDLKNPIESTISEENKSAFIAKNTDLCNKDLATIFKKIIY